MNYTSRLGSNGTAASGPNAANKTAEQDSAKMSVSMIVNGPARTITIEPRMTLLDALCEELGLTSTKKSCDRDEARSLHRGQSRMTTVDTLINATLNPFVGILRRSGLLTEYLDYHVVRASMVIISLFRIGQR